MPSDTEFPPKSRKRGWAGEEMEMAHQREKIRQEMKLSSGDGGASANANVNAKYSTVNLEQFRNREVGKGYQARGVIRQRTGMTSGGSGSMTILDMTKKPLDVNGKDENDNGDGDGESATSVSVTRSVDSGMNTEESMNKMKRRSKKKKKHHRRTSTGTSRSKRNGNEHEHEDENESYSRSSQNANRKNPITDEWTMKYIALKGIRDFRKELHKIISEENDQKSNTR